MRRFFLLSVLIFDIRNIIGNETIKQNESFLVTKRYHITGQTRTFVGALISCQTLGMNLATIENANEQKAIINAIKDSRSSNGAGYWIGAAAEETSTDSWYWLKSGLKMVYKNWGTNQPRDIGSGESGSCVRLGSFYKENVPNKWQNVDCNTLLMFVCEKLDEII